MPAQQSLLTVGNYLQEESSFTYRSSRLIVAIVEIACLLIYRLARNGELDAKSIPTVQLCRSVLAPVKVRTHRLHGHLMLR